MNNTQKLKRIIPKTPDQRKQQMMDSCTDFPWQPLDHDISTTDLTFRKTQSPLKKPGSLYLMDHKITVKILYVPSETKVTCKIKREVPTFPEPSLSFKMKIKDYQFNENESEEFNNAPYVNIRGSVSMANVASPKLAVANSQILDRKPRKTHVAPSRIPKPLRMNVASASGIKMPQFSQIAGIAQLDDSFDVEPPTFYLNFKAQRLPQFRHIQSFLEQPCFQRKMIKGQLAYKLPELVPDHCAKKQNPMIQQENDSYAIFVQIPQMSDFIIQEILNQQIIKATYFKFKTSTDQPFTQLQIQPSTTTKLALMTLHVISPLPQEPTSIIQCDFENDFSTEFTVQTSQNVNLIFPPFSYFLSLEKHKFTEQKLKNGLKQIIQFIQQKSELFQPVQIEGKTESRFEIKTECEAESTIIQVIFLNEQEQKDVQIKQLKTQTEFKSNNQFNLIKCQVQNMIKSEQKSAEYKGKAINIMEELQMPSFKICQDKSQTQQFVLQIEYTQGDSATYFPEPQNINKKLEIQVLSTQTSNMQLCKQQPEQVIQLSQMEDFAFEKRAKIVYETETICPVNINIKEDQIQINSFKDLKMKNFVIDNEITKEFVQTDKQMELEDQIPVITEQLKLDEIQKEFERQFEIIRLKLLECGSHKDSNDMFTFLKVSYRSIMCFLSSVDDTHLNDEEITNMQSGIFSDEFNEKYNAFKYSQEALRNPHRFFFNDTESVEHEFVDLLKKIKNRTLRLWLSQKFDVARGEIKCLVLDEEIVKSIIEKYVNLIIVKSTDYQNALIQTYNQLQSMGTAQALSDSNDVLERVNQEEIYQQSIQNIIDIDTLYDTYTEFMASPRSKF
ncbi:Hypothetical_protein [Hexamita inflata]|uniref:Hypothetical_protein n=1 Tax=Hexamita inflata TaxID=28002 RepID=A0ABP1H6V5_9EUKA